MPKKILIMEDEIILAKLYQKKLEQADFDVLCCHTIKDTEKELSTFNPDIILLDQSMNGEEKSGMDLIPFARKTLPQSKIIMLSNYSDFHFKEEALAAGADDYLVKINHSPSQLSAYLHAKFL